MYAEASRCHIAYRAQCCEVQSRLVIGQRQLRRGYERSLLSNGKMHSLMLNLYSSLTYVDELKGLRKTIAKVRCLYSTTLKGLGRSLVLLQIGIV